MNWFNDQKLKDQEGDTRIALRFMWWPRSFGGSTVRWLEWVKVQEQVIKLDTGGSDQWGSYGYYWRGIEFAGEEI